jgi:hypothetical protein
MQVKPSPRARTHTHTHTGTHTYLALSASGIGQSESCTVRCRKTFSCSPLHAYIHPFKTDACSVSLHIVLVQYTGYRIQDTGIPAVQENSPTARGVHRISSSSPLFGKYSCARKKEISPPSDGGGDVFPPIHSFSSLIARPRRDDHVQTHHSCIKYALPAMRESIDYRGQSQAERHYAYTR